MCVLLVAVSEIDVNFLSRYFKGEKSKFGVPNNRPGSIDGDISIPLLVDAADFDENEDECASASGSDN